MAHESHVALVTGSTSGIGLGIARAFAERGHKIVLNGLGTPAELSALAGELSDAYGVEVRASGADMTDAIAIAEMFDEIEAELGTVDILVNNAGVQHVAPVEEFPPEKWDLVLALNLSAAFYTSRRVFCGMKARGFGRIINIASAHGLVASPFKSAYVAAKHGILGLTKTLALEGAQHGVTVNAICPGYVMTPLVQAQIPDTARTRGLTEDEVIRDVLLAAQPSKTFVQIEELGALAVFLSEPGAASINGAALPVDGGWTAQ